MTRSLRHAGLVPPSTVQPATTSLVEEWTPEQVRGDGLGVAREARKQEGVSIEGDEG